MKNNFDTIDDAVCEYLDNKNGATVTERGYNYWSASSLGKCMRYQVLGRAAILTNGAVNYAWKNAAEDGHMAHAWRQHALHRVGILVDSEQEITDEDLHYRGHYDLIVDLNGILTLGDIKTQNNKAFKARSRMPDKIDPHHKRQLGSYFYFLRRDTYPDLKSARLYYVNKNTGQREEIEVLFEEPYLQDIINELKTLNLYWERRIVPKRDVTSFCRICQFRELCSVLHNRKDTTVDHAIQRSISTEA